MNNIEVGQVWRMQVATDWVVRWGNELVPVPEETQVVIKKVDYNWGALIFCLPSGQELASDINDFIASCEEVEAIT